MLVVPEPIPFPNHQSWGVHARPQLSRAWVVAWVAVPTVSQEHRPQRASVGLNVSCSQCLTILQEGPVAVGVDLMSQSQQEVLPKLKTVRELPDNLIHAVQPLDKNRAGLIGGLVPNGSPRLELVPKRAELLLDHLAEPSDGPILSIHADHHQGGRLGGPIPSVAAMDHHVLTLGEVVHDQKHVLQHHPHIIIPMRRRHTPPPLRRRAPQAHGTHRRAHVPPAVPDVVNVVHIPEFHIHRDVLGVRGLHASLAESLAGEGGGVGSQVQDEEVLVAADALEHLLILRAPALPKWTKPLRALTASPQGSIVQLWTAPRHGYEPVLLAKSGALSQLLLRHVPRKHQYLGVRSAEAVRHVQCRDLPWRLVVATQPQVLLVGVVQLPSIVGVIFGALPGFATEKL
mmetsp:Transcript_23318/g.59900  ORF Transcript_23318/g.59900 Transcript_23318/m.59900 type:complete len:400 (-) Transcript_23318:718-1917(-)